MNKLKYFFIVFFTSLLIITFLYNAIQIIIDKNKINLELKNDYLSIGFIGDIQLARSNGELSRKYGNNFLFKNIASYLNKFDLAVGNLECAASYIGSPKYGKPQYVLFRAEPGMLLGLKYAGINAVSLANNHSTDFNSPALFETIELLELLNIKHFGAGNNLTNARKPALIQINNITIVILGYSQFIWDMTFAEENKFGVAPLKEELINDDLIKVKKEYPDAFIILSLHWGTEYSNYPSKAQIELGHRFINNGADMIVGHHPHVLQGIEIYKGKIIAYSLGNFIFDQPYNACIQSMIVSIKLKKQGIFEILITPVIIDKNTFQPAIAKNSKAIEILNNIKTYSNDFNSKIEVTDDIGRLIF